MRYDYEITVLTPVFIGNCQEINRTDYYYDKNANIINVLDLDKLFYEIDKKKHTIKPANTSNNKNLKGFASLANLFETEVEYITDYAESVKANGVNFDVANWLQKNKLLDILDNCISYKISVGEVEDYKSNSIQLFVKDIYGLPYIPGSSLKGMIVSALTDYLLAGNIISGKHEVDNKLEQFKNTIMISDSEPIANGQLELVKKIDVNSNAHIQSSKRKKPLPTCRESLKAGTKIKFSIILKKGTTLTIEQIENSLRLRDKLIFGESGVIGCQKNIIDEFLPTNYYTKSPNDIPFVIGGGAGFHSKTNVMGEYKNAVKANEETKKILKNAFKNHNHDTDGKLSPRGIKVGNSENKLSFLGLCTMKRI